MATLGVSGSDAPDIIADIAIPLFAAAPPRPGHARLRLAQRQCCTGARTQHFWSNPSQEMPIGYGTRKRNYGAMQHSCYLMSRVARGRKKGVQTMTSLKTLLISGTAFTALTCLFAGTGFAQTTQEAAT
ncbi:hypothetical protein R593_24710, partial [Salmonella enterica subsp. enterica serovar Newport]